jgi:hypothetical protein
MNITEISNIIEKSIYAITERNHKDECSDCWIDERNYREDKIEALALLLDTELFNLDKLMDEITEDVFSKKEENPDFYKKLSEADEHLDAIRRTAEIIRYFEAINDGINKIRFRGCDQLKN